ncbi:MAG: DUF222 domain-containing protein [Streptosporangiales bacterium]
MTSWAQARELAAVAELARRRGVALAPQPGRPPADQLKANFAPNEIALALTLTGCSADYWMSLAVSLDSRLPATLATLAGGKIDLARAKLIDQYTTVLDDDQARMVEARVLPKAERQTTGQLRAALLRAVLAVDPAAAERRRKEAERNARVELTGEPEGTASLLGRFLPAAQASAAWSRIDMIAKALEDSGAAGGIDLLRAQVLLRLLLGQPPSPPAEDTPASPDRAGPGPAGPDAPGAGPRAPRPGTPAGPDAPRSWPNAPSWPGCGWPDPWFDGVIPGLGQALSRALCRRTVLTAPWRTLAGLIQEPGHLGRVDPVTASVARYLARAAAADVTCEWRIIVVDERGHPVATGIPWPRANRCTAQGRATAAGCACCSHCRAGPAVPNGGGGGRRTGAGRCGGRCARNGHADLHAERCAARGTGRGQPGHREPGHREPGPVLA